MKQIIQIPASKSISNRLLILQYLYPFSIKIYNLSSANDTIILQKSLKKLKNFNKQFISINIEDAGTAMRFLTALLSIQKNKIFMLDGSNRMQQRPIKILINALQELGAEISYQKNIGYPPLLIKGRELNKNKIQIPANISSQYITALMLIAPKLPKGLNISLTNKQVSKPYINMTANLLKEIGIKIKIEKTNIFIQNSQKLSEQFFFIEGDWSSASYFYGKMLVSNEKELVLTPFFPNSWQGDSKVVTYFQQLGIKTTFIPKKKQILLHKIANFKLPEYIKFNLLDTPDLAQTLAVSCLAMGIKCKLTGLETLKIKETDRLIALQTEMQKIGATVYTTQNSLEIIHPNVKNNLPITINTYNDHRMAMSFAILQQKYPMISIANMNVVSKSFPNFWEIFN